MSKVVTDQQLKEIISQAIKEANLKQHTMYLLCQQKMIDSSISSNFDEVDYRVQQILEDIAKQVLDGKKDEVDYHAQQALEDMIKQVLGEKKTASNIYNSYIETDTNTKRRKVK